MYMIWLALGLLDSVPKTLLLVLYKLFIYK